MTGSGAAALPHPHEAGPSSIVPPMMIPFRLLMVPACVCLAAEAMPAQKLAYHQIPWHVAADSVRAPLRAQGFAFQEVTESGDHAFTREDGARLNAELRNGRLIGFTLHDAVRGEPVAGRYDALADSLQAELGAPDETGDEDQWPMRLWEAGLTSVRVEVTRVGGERMVRVAWRGPGWYDELERRSGRAPQPAGFTTVSVTPFLRIAVDTTVDGPRAAGALRGRFRIEYFQPITPSLDGVEQDPLDTVEYEMDVDCAGGRTRLIARTTYLEGRRLGSHRPQGQPWTTPRQPDGHYARGLAAVCRAARPVR
ncbi:MAG TPA: hypothetical protein VGC13_03350 [Longimicrobium sp.]|jgi:hypothetical protein|uniref:hypothetical protein n=1 Tax=Longimicrobium sp. TaxID=2029185 RepID=UPI002EDA7626